MPNSTVPEELLSLRQQIDTLDDEILNLLARRFQVTAEVGKLKASKKLDSVDEARERQKLEELQEQARSKDLNPEFILHLFQMIFAEVVNNHQSYRQ
ncbi:MAG: chorismate mutase [Gammaproteobacteria bacterium]|nr:chorismate mutase [Gammaproteobacteria bacterium]MAY03736.1 chorismate mutase [Gammaproteobacteria bacterium]|tara:strand:+ start:1577 stop:1867 length:291 start_codon:yes stop_codon:yes gene_type:complete